MLTTMSNPAPLLMIGLPKGSLEESTKSLFAKAGWVITTSSRSYKPSINDPELDGRFIRAQEVSRYVEHGFFDCGLTGYDWVQENQSDVVEVCDLIYSRASTQKSRWVLCVPENSPVQKPEDLAGKRVATEMVGTVKRYFEKRNIPVTVEFSWGATEVKVPDLVDAIVDITETGSSLRANKLRIVDTLLTTNTKLIANKASWANPEKRKKIETIALMLTAALEAGSKVGLKLNAPKAKLDDLLKSLPSLRNPTISPLSSTEWVALETIIDEKVVREIIPQLKAMGAEGIIEYPLNKVVY
ncbi:ATP phosphoribosyltransferase [Ereboglobus sp. PH5-10]|nr:ATP phosphoribosyltransferase [Ereboglobus sp. PH5-10]